MVLDNWAAVTKGFAFADLGARDGPGGGPKPPHGGGRVDATTVLAGGITLTASATDASLRDVNEPGAAGPTLRDVLVTATAGGEGARGWGWGIGERRWWGLGGGGHN